MEPNADDTRMMEEKIKLEVERHKDYISKMTKNAPRIRPVTRIPEVTNLLDVVLSTYYTVDERSKLTPGFSIINMYSLAFNHIFGENLDIQGSGLVPIYRASE
jgi:hypothetical protein